MTDPAAPQATPFAAWLRHEDQHLRGDCIGKLAAQLRGDPDEPNPFNLPELACYLVTTNADATFLEAAHYAWAAYIAALHPALATGAAEYAELMSIDNPDCAVRLSVGSLLDEVGLESDDEDFVAGLLCGLAPWLLPYDTTIRVEGGTVTLAYVPGVSEYAHARYSGSAWEPC